MCPYDRVMAKLKKNFDNEDIVITTGPDKFIVDDFVRLECLLELFAVEGYMVVDKGDLAKSGITSEDLQSLGVMPLMPDGMSGLLAVCCYDWYI